MYSSLFFQNNPTYLELTHPSVSPPIWQAPLPALPQMTYDIPPDPDYQDADEIKSNLAAMATTKMVDNSFDDDDEVDIIYCPFYILY